MRRLLGGMRSGGDKRRSHLKPFLIPKIYTSEGYPSSVMNLSEWRARLESERKQKDWFFAVNPRSPIPPGKREDFGGLEYYPPNSECRFELKLHEYNEKKTLRMTATSGGEQEYIRWGEFRFRLGGEEYRLQAYKRDPREQRLFVPFRDATSGRETYGAGRYIDLDPERHSVDGGRWILDFNEAYNPFCAYSKAYTCPLTPLENWLDIPIEAGEKKYASEAGH